MSYFEAGGRELGTLPPQAQTNGYGRLGRLGQLPPQAQTNGLGRFGMIGMMPPQAAAGIGDDMTPKPVEGDPRSWRDGIFGGRRAPEAFGEQSRPWKDGILGPSLGTTPSGPALTLNAPAMLELKTALNLLTTYSMTAGDAYDMATEAAYIDYCEHQTPGYADKSELFHTVGGQAYPSARGIFVLMQGARLKWAESTGQDASYAQVASFYPILWTFTTEFEAAGGNGSVVVPGAAIAAPTVKPSTAAMLGIGSMAAGLAYILLRRPKRSTTPNRRRTRRRR